MPDQIAFELVSPEKLLLSKPVSMVTVPGSEGDFGVMPGHAPLIAAMRPGVIDVYEGEQISERLFVAGGFAEVTGERCTVLAETATPVNELTREGVEKEIRNLGEDLADAKTDAEREALQAKLVIARARLDAVTGAAH